MADCAAAGAAPVACKWPTEGVETLESVGGRAAAHLRYRAMSDARAREWRR